MNRRYTSFFFFLIAVLLALVLVPAGSAGEYSHARIVRLSYVSGDVQISSGADAGWQKAIVNTPLREGMSLATTDGHAEVEFENGATARISNNTVLQFLELALEDGAKRTRLAVTQGTATIYSKPGQHEVFVVEGGKLSLRVSGDSRFRLDVFDDGSSVSVLKGRLDVTAAGNLQSVGKGQTLATRTEPAARVAVERNPAPDAWDKWVSQRDDAMIAGRNNSLAYSNSPVSYGLADLSYYGSWTNCGIGNCWQPYGMGPGWSPFMAGVWTNTPGFGLTWTSFEPWGWLPYHYGRWTFFPGTGWLWMPGYFNSWSPATVYWVRTNNQVGWVPLAPNDKPGVTPANMSAGLVTTSSTGLVSGAPNTLGSLTPGTNPRFTMDPRQDPELLRSAQQLRTTPGTTVVASGTTGVSGTAGLKPAQHMGSGHMATKTISSTGFPHPPTSFANSRSSVGSRGSLGSSSAGSSSGVSRTSSSGAPQPAPHSSGSSSPAPKGSSTSPKPH